MSRPQPRMDTHGDVFGARIVAFIIDSIVIGIVAAVLALVVGGIGVGLGGENGMSGAILLLTPVFILLQYGYFIYFEGKSGQTPGKSLMSIVVVKDDGTDCDYGAAAIRNVLRIIDQLGIVIPYLVGLIVMYVTDEHQRVGDIVANTVVVRTR